MNLKNQSNPMKSDKAILETARAINFILEKVKTYNTTN